MDEAILNQPQFQDAEKAREYMEAIRWPNARVCPHCGSAGEHYKLQGNATRPGVYKCSDCREQFTVTVGTLFEGSKVGLEKWLTACYLLSCSEKGVSNKQLERMLGVSYKTAWFMSHRIREAMDNGGGNLGGSGTPVEAGEIYWGNNGKQAKGARGGDHKMKAVSLVERDGQKRSFDVTNVSANTLRPTMKKHIHEDSRLMKDDAKVYNEIGVEFGQHQSVNHGAKEYARGDVTTNAVETSFAILKSGLYGTFHSVSEKHLQRLANEFDFRWNNRAKLGVSDLQRTNNLLSGIGEKRLMYRRTDAT